MLINKYMQKAYTTARENYNENNTPTFETAFCICEELSFDKLNRLRDAINDDVELIGIVWRLAELLGCHHGYEDQCKREEQEATQP